MKPRLTLLIVMIFGAAALRLVPHPPNLNPVAALALFAGAHVDNRRWAFLIPLAAMLLSDIIIGFHDQMPLVYLAFALMVGMGFFLRERRTFLPVTGMALAASGLFFTLSNFGVWALGTLYPRTMEGLVACYVAAIPFFGYTLGGTLVYTAVLFGTFALAERAVPSLLPAERS